MTRIRVRPFPGAVAGAYRSKVRVKLVGRILGWLLLLAALGALGYDLAQLYHGAGFGLSPLGQIWFDIDAPSLNLVQAVVERYIWPPLWDPGITTLLLWPGVLVFLVPGLLLVVLCRRPRRKRWFR